MLEGIEPGRWATYDGAQGKSRFLWYQRAISGISEGALNWSSALSSLTGVPSLHRLTLLPLRCVLAAKGLMAKQARWCPPCLAEDKNNGQIPYFRLAWDIGQTKVCAQHGVELVARCPHCNGSNVRHKASVVVPGWCTSCDHFLGVSQSINPIESIQAEQAHETKQADCIGALLAVMSVSQPDDAFIPSLQAFHQAVVRLVAYMDGGVAAHFARRLGVGKSTVHYWGSAEAPLTLDALTRISQHCDVPLAKLVQGQLEDWTPPPAARQLALKLDCHPAPSYRKRREHDWVTIRAALEGELNRPAPRSVADIAKSLDIDERLLYIQASSLAQQLGKRRVRYLRECSSRSQASLHEQLRQACDQILENGEGVTVESVGQLVGWKTLNATRNLYTVLSNLAQQASNDAQF